MKRVFKYEIADGEFQLPVSARIAYVGLQDRPRFWAEVEVDEKSREPEEYVGVRMRVFGTGWEVPDGWYHLGTWFQGPLVWHAYTDRRLKWARS